MIPYYRPPKIPPKDRRALTQDIGQILESGLITNGEMCRRLEERMAKLHAVDYAIVCSSCTIGLNLVLEALKAKVIAMPSFTWKSVDYITRSRFQRVWMDIDPETWLQIPTFLQFGEKRKIDTYLIQNTFGSLSDFPIENMAEEANVIYDGAYSTGCKDLKIGDAVVLSTTATKSITSCEGGVILTNSKILARELTELRDRCSRMSEVHALIGLYYLNRLSEIIDKKKQIFEYYRRKMPYPCQEIPLTTTYGYYGMLVDNRDTLIEKIRDKIEYRIRYEPVIEGLKNTDYVYEHILCLPCYVDCPYEKVVEVVLDD